jgi:V-type H+-transporting ATPase subunit a
MFIDDLKYEENSVKRGGKDFFDDVETNIIKEEENMVELMNSYDAISESLAYIKEKKAVYDKIAQLILSGSGEMYERSSRLDEEGGGSGITTVAGVVKAEDEIKMKRMIFRVSRGRATPTFFDLPLKDSLTKEPLNKKIFTIFFPGGQENVLLQKLIKVCDIYNASRFNLPRSEDMRSEIISLQSEISEKDGYLKQAKTLMDDFLGEKIGSTIDQKAAKYDLYKKFLEKEKYIYTNLNKCLLGDNFVEGEIWATEENFPKVAEEINKLGHDLSLSATFFDKENSKLKPPTHIKCTDLTYPFQKITDAYGVPRYGEINPSLFSCVSFPFLFGIMFGDIGHGGLLLIFALYLTFW